jgi:hypothetical protein
VPGSAEDVEFLVVPFGVGGAVREARDRAYEVVIAQIARYVAGQPLLNVIGPRGY